jgi:hypothetical protein
VLEINCTIIKNNYWQDILGPIYLPGKEITIVVDSTAGLQRGRELDVHYYYM